MSIRKLAVAVALGVFAASGYVFAQAPAAPAAAPAPAPAAVEEATAEAVEEEAVEEEVAAPEPVAVPAVAAEPAPAVEAAPVAAAAPAKPETKVDFYGTASYRFRGRYWNATDKSDKSGTSFDYLNLLGWSFGAKVKVDDQLSLQFQIGNDLNAGESVQWADNNMPSARLNTLLKDGYGQNDLRGLLTSNLYVHLAYATWNPGPIYLTGGVIPVVSNGTLDLLERSLSTGSYGDAIFQTWATQTNNSLIAIKLGAPLLKEGTKINLELTSSVIDARTQSLIGNSKTTGAVNTDTSVTLEPKANPTGVLFILDLPVVAGNFKVTPQVTYVLNRNYNTTLEKGDDESLYGLSLSYKINDGVSVNGNFAAGSVSNENSKVGSYGSGTIDDRSAKVDQAKADTTRPYISNGLIFGLGSTIKAGPGAIALGYNYGNAYNGAAAYDEPIKDDDGEVIDSKHIDPKNQTNKVDHLIDVRYTWNAHSKFSIAPRFRAYITTYDGGSGHIKSKMEYRPELILTGSF